MKIHLLLTYPLSLLYGFATWCRNKLFDLGILRETGFKLPIIGIGNLSLGGTGKTPHIEYFVSQYQNTYKIAVLSRGYGRKTKGYLEVKPSNTASETGDEPLQIKLKYPDIKVFVCENRVHGVNKIQSEHPEVNLILLDDSYQHRYIKPKLNILLTTYHRPFWKDMVVPAGRLREFGSGPSIILIML